jgi:hypothetical protein
VLAEQGEQRALVRLAEKQRIPSPRPLNHIFRGGRVVTVDIPAPCAAGRAGCRTRFR